MYNEFLKRFLSSFILLTLSFFLILEGKLFFNFFLIILLIISFKEWFTLSYTKFLFYLGFFFLIVSFATVYQIRNFESLNDLGLFYFFLIFTICISTDVGGYIFGNFLKGAKLTKISPKKTISGCFGSYILSLISTTLYLNYSNFFFVNVKIYGDEIYLIIIFISTVSQFGDLIISFFKRSSNKKNTGNLIPGHGGVLDRIDGMIFSFPVFYILIFYNIL